MWICVKYRFSNFINFAEYTDSQVETTKMEQITYIFYRKNTGNMIYFYE